MLKKFLSNPTTYPTLICLATLFVLAIAFFSPLLGGKVLPQGDVVNATGMQKNIQDYRKAHPGDEPYWSTSMFSGMPALTISAHYKGNVLEQLRHVGELGLPYPIGYFFVGMALFFGLLRVCGLSSWAALPGAVGYGFFSYFIMIVEAGHVNKFLVLMLLPGALLAIVLGYKGKYLLGGALLFLLLGLQFYYNHVQMTYYMLFVVAAYVVWQLVLAVQQGRLRQFALASGTLLAGALLALSLNAVPLYPLYQYTQFTIRGPNELSTATQEDKTGGLNKDYAYGWSYGRSELFTLIAPNAAGGGAGMQYGKGLQAAKVLRNIPEAAGANVDGMAQQWLYWGAQPFTAGPFYLGAVLVFLFVLGLLLVQGGITWALLYASLLAVLLALGQFGYSLTATLALLALPVIYFITRRWVKAVPPALYAVLVAVLGVFLVNMLEGDATHRYRLYDLLFDVLPLFNKFRVPSSILIILALTVPWLAALALGELTNPARPAATKRQALLYAAGISGGFCLVLAVGATLFFSFAAPQDAELRQSLIQGLPGGTQQADEVMAALRDDRANLLRADAMRSFAFIALGAGVLYLLVLGRIRQTGLAFGLVAVLTIADLWAVDRRILDERSFVRKSDYSRYFTPRQADEALLRDTTYFRVFPLSRNPFNDGHTPYFLNTVGGYNAAKLRRYQQLIERHLSKASPNVLNMLNVKYLITDKPLQSPQFAEMLKTTDGELVYLNRTAYGPAWIVQRIKVVPTPDQALDTLGVEASWEEAVLEAKDAQGLPPFSQDSLNHEVETLVLLHHDNKHIRYQYASPKARFVTFSEVYHPDWVVTVDGQPARLVPANFVLRGMVVPAGKHLLAFEYLPKSIQQSERVSLIASILLVITLVGAVVVQLRSGRPKENLIPPTS